MGKVKFQQSTQGRSGTGEKETYYINVVGNIIVVVLGSTVATIDFVLYCLLRKDVMQWSLYLLFMLMCKRKQQNIVRVFMEKCERNAENCIF